MDLLKAEGANKQRSTMFSLIYYMKHLEYSVEEAFSKAWQLENRANKAFETLDDLDTSGAPEILMEVEQRSGSYGGLVTAEVSAESDALSVAGPTPPPSGELFTFGTGVSGSLGYDEVFMAFPCQVPSLASVKVKAVACGFAHTIVLTESGKVLSFGSNSIKELGRATDTGVDYEAKQVELPEAVAQITAGDHHSAALTVGGNVFAWGAFELASWDMFVTVQSAKDEAHSGNVYPITILDDLGDCVKVKEIASGSNHLVFLAESGSVYSMGSNEHGQLGRSQFDKIRLQSTRRPNKTVQNATERIQNYHSHPKRVPVMSVLKEDLVISNVFCSKNASFFVAYHSGDVYVCGLNCFSELGIESVENVLSPIKSPAFTLKADDSKVEWNQICGGDSHIVALSNDGSVYTMGESERPQLGLGDFIPKDATLTMVEPLKNNCSSVAAGYYSSYAVTIDGKLYAWGKGWDGLLATGDDEDQDSPSLCMAGVGTPINQRVLRISAGTCFAAVIFERQDDDCGSSQ
ncbi:Regulator of chromosome condensation [Orchesella cincta]|uniref:Regulator of chromosome condensation n=1 Tax=Orchesella cincta TaxID=48709 RepID=A0A1D2M3W5_ORCCI|nr:Regulator of chromosome condensation [Orchesella cincta]